MTNSTSNAYKIALKSAIALTQDLKTHPDANEHFEELYQELANENEQMADLLKLLWDDYIAAQRSAAFWQGMSDAEKGLADQVTQSNLQLQRNYMRLMQEQ
ncbi:MAG: hypothetical protein F6J97_05575 [Leptolyngbya sp. SIO4C1]|nr:hypothetical protein [Leptolyngbya sp. SIO4C1]